MYRFWCTWIIVSFRLHSRDEPLSHKIYTPLLLIYFEAFKAKKKNQQKKQIKQKQKQKTLKIKCKTHIYSLTLNCWLFIVSPISSAILKQMGRPLQTLLNAVLFPLCSYRFLRPLQKPHHCDTFCASFLLLFYFCYIFHNL